MVKVEKRKTRFLRSLMAVMRPIAMLALAFVAIQATAPGQSSQRGKNEAVQRVKQYPDTPIGFENYEGVPLAIQEAKVKEIGNAEYYQLTHVTTDSPKYVSFPNVTLVNNTDQRVTSLTLVVGNKQTKRIHGVKLNHIIIEPHGSFSVKASDFVRAERTVHITQEGKAKNSLKPGLDSEKMWFQGGAEDVILVVGMVDFENGNRWMIDKSKDPW
jgi:hypothetical protein